MDQWTSFWYTALHSPFGLILSSDDPDTALQRLYSSRRKANDPALEILSVCRPVPGQLWLVKKEPKP